MNTQSKTTETNIRFPDNCDKLLEDTINSNQHKISLDNLKMTACERDSQCFINMVHITRLVFDMNLDFEFELVLAFDSFEIAGSILVSSQKLESDMDNFLDIVESLLIKHDDIGIHYENIATLTNLGKCEGDQCMTSILDIKNGIKEMFAGFTAKNLMNSFVNELSWERCRIEFETPFDTYQMAI
jgi:hypothetical protein